MSWIQEAFEVKTLQEAKELFDRMRADKVSAPSLAFQMLWSRIQELKIEALEERVTKLEKK